MICALTLVTMLPSTADFGHFSSGNVWALLTPNLELAVREAKGYNLPCRVCLARLAMPQRI